jgi:hypothetical protein
MAKITYPEKFNNKQISLAENKKVTAGNLNEIKASVNSLYDIVENLEVGAIVFVSTLSDLPTPVNGVITLEAGKTYIITTDLDLQGNRLVAGGICNLFGLSSETSYLTSTGLPVGVPLLTSEYTIVVERISFRDVDTAVSIDGNVNLVALDWKAVNFINIPNVGVINSCDNFIFDTGAFLGAQGLKFTGTIGTIGINNSLFRGTGDLGNIIEIDDNCIITRRFRIIYSSIISFGDTTAIHVDTDATIPVESYILDTINFSGNGTRLSGITDTFDPQNITLFVTNVGIENTSVNGQMYMRSNASATTISNTVDFFKVAGITLPSTDNQKYEHSNNRLTNKARVSRKYKVIATLSFTAGANNVCQFGLFDSKLNDIRQPSIQPSTANAGGRAESITLTCAFSHSDGDYIEVWCRNTSATTNITLTDMNVLITEII